jgi:hypothetical protein
VRLVYIFSLALGPHPQRELTLMAHAQRAFALARFAMAAGAPTRGPSQLGPYVARSQRISSGRLGLFPYISVAARKIFDVARSDT